jgi:Tol biopolymer transport system component
MPVWSPDGTRIAFQRKSSAQESDLYIMVSDGGNVTQITFNEAADTMPAWSPDGRAILLVSEREGNAEIYLIQAQPTGLFTDANIRRLTNNVAADLRPAWSSDGSLIVFERVVDGNSDLYVMNADGTDQRRVTDAASAESAPNWGR